MALNSVQNTLTGALAASLQQINVESKGREKSDSPSQGFDHIELSSLGDRLASLIATDPSSDVVAGLRDQLEQLKSFFAEELQEQLNGMGIEKPQFTITKAADGHFDISNANVDTEQITKAFEDNPTLSKTFDQMSDISEALHKVDNTPSLMQARTGLQAYLSQTETEFFQSSFQLAMNGSNISTFWM